MIQARTVLALLFLLSLSVSLTCGKSPTGPEPLKDPRTYTWKIDTLVCPGSFQTDMDNIWGSNPQDVYIVGHASGCFSEMYHYDGNTWTPLKLDSRDGGSIELIGAFGGIFGFSSRDIYAVGVKYPSGKENSLVIHFDGTTWREHNVAGGAFLQGVWGISPTDLWVGGTQGSLFHFDGATWKKFSLPDSIWIAEITGFAANEVYASAYTTGSLGLHTMYILKWDGKTWVITDLFTESVSTEDRFGPSVVALEGKLFSLGAGVFVYTSAGWQRIFGYRFTWFSDLAGTSSNNFFVVGNYGLVYHYDGQGWFQFTQFASSSVHYYGCWTDGREVFIVGTEGGGGKSFVLHGR